LFSAICFRFLPINEHFQSLLETPVLIYKIDASITPIYVYNPYPEIDLLQYWRKITYIDTTESIAKSSMQVCDVFNVAKKTVITVIPDTYTIVAVFKNRSNRAARLKDVMQLRGMKNVTIGIFDAKAKPFAQFIGSVTDTLPIIRVVENNDKRMRENDIFIKYGTQQNIKRFIEKHQDVMDFLDVHTIDIHTLKASWEYARYESIDLSKVFMKQVNPLPIMKFIVFHVFLVQTKPIAREYTDQILQLVTNMGPKALAINNYYTLFFTYAPIVQSYMTAKNDHIHKRSTGKKLQILEEFVDRKPFVYDMENEIPGFFDSTSLKFYVTNVDSIYVPLKVGIMLRLTKQKMSIQNGVYTVIHVDDTQTILQRNTPFKTKGGKDERLDGRYKCYGDPYILNEGLCNSLLDEAGQLKPVRTYWDRPCETNEECPFYQKNKTYKSYRGGCNGGFCELPIGVERLSWRLYDKNTKPVCHGCQPSDVRCCDARNKDYAFQLDYYERRKPR